MRSEEEIREKKRLIQIELDRKPSNVVEWSPYWKKKFRLWLEALEWVLNDKGEK